MKAFTFPSAPSGRADYKRLSPLQAFGIVLACAIVVGCGSLMLPFG